jgi:uncharacterized protein YfaS (alpha-2-macroglobulin family)
MAWATMRRLDQPSSVASLALGGLPEVSLDVPAAWWWRSHHFLSREAAFAARLYTRALSNDAGVGSSLQVLLDKLAEEPYVSTHTISWALLAVDSTFTAPTGTVGATVSTPTGRVHQVTTANGENQVGGPLARDAKGAFTITSAAPNRSLFGYITFRGWPLQPPRQGFAQQLEVRRLYLDEAGHLLTPPFAVRQGQRLFVALLARHTLEGVTQLSNVAIEDRLPAGLELENLRLLAADALPALPQAWRGTGVLQPDYVDYLDDKIAVFGTLSRDFRAFLFPVRAVSQGTFQLMPTTAEAMYIPEVRALQVGDGQMTITAPRLP